MWDDAHAGLMLAHVRLAIIDLSAAGHQPMVSACGRYVLVLNGEIYNHAVLRSRLEQAGRAPDWRGHSDTESVLASFAEWGVEATLQACVGMFSLALWDREARIMFSGLRVQSELDTLYKVTCKVSDINSTRSEK